MSPLAVTVTVAELHSRKKNRRASWKNGKRSLTHKPQRRGVQKPYKLSYKSIETAESDHILFIRVFLPSFQCRLSLVR